MSGIPICKKIETSPNSASLVDKYIKRSRHFLAHFVRSPLWSTNFLRSIISRCFVALLVLFYRKARNPRRRRGECKTWSGHLRGPNFGWGCGAAGTSFRPLPHRPSPSRVHEFQKRRQSNVFLRIPIVALLLSLPFPLLSRCRRQI